MVPGVTLAVSDPSNKNATTGNENAAVAQSKIIGSCEGVIGKIDTRQNGSAAVDQGTQGILEYFWETKWIGTQERIQHVSRIFNARASVSGENLGGLGLLYFPKKRGSEVESPIIRQLGCIISHTALCTAALKQIKAV